MLNVFIKCLLALVKFLALIMLIPAIVLGSFFVIWSIAACIFFIIAYRKGERIVHIHKVNIKEHGWLHKLFVQAPRMMIYDLMHRDPQQFGYHGLILFTGRQGYGKTVSAAQFIRKARQEYPLSKTITNFDYQDQDDELTHWKQLLDYNNAQKGVIVGIDELQNWFSSKQSANFPPEMLEVVTQNRKNRRVIVGTSQNFSSVAKDIRKQCTEVRECVTFFGCITLVHRKRAELNSEGDVEKWHSIGWYWYVHDVALRDSYDTYKVIESLSRSGFNERQINIVG